MKQEKIQELKELKELKELIKDAIRSSQSDFINAIIDSFQFSYDGELTIQQMDRLCLALETMIDLADTLLFLTTDEVKEVFEGEEND